MIENKIEETKNIGQEPEDIFAAVDHGGAVNKKREEPIVSYSYSNQPFLSPKKKIIFLVCLILSVILILIGLFFFFKKTGLIGSQQSGSNEATELKNEKAAKKDENEKQTKINFGQINTDIVSGDRDKDGLSDEEDGKLGLNLQKADTDDDGLFDSDEIKIYQTDPLKPDTDGDGFLDGEEVRQGYNPRGDGKLLNFQKALEELKNKK